MMKSLSLSESLPERERWRPVPISRCRSHSSKVFAKSSRQQNSAMIEVLIEGIPSVDFGCGYRIRPRPIWEPPHPSYPELGLLRLCTQLYEEIA